MRRYMKQAKEKGNLDSRKQSNGKKEGIKDENRMTMN